MKPTFILALLMALLLPTAQAVTLKIATLAPSGTNWMKEMKKGADAIKKQTENRVKIKFYPGGVMGNDASVLRKIRINQLQGGAFSTSGLSPISTSVQALSLPMVFKNYEEADRVRPLLTNTISDALRSEGFVLLGLTEGGFARVMSNQRVASIEDFRNSKVWVPEGDELVLVTLETMGINPIPLPISDVFTGLQTGLIDTITTTSAGAIAFQWHTRLNYLIDTPVIYVVGLLAVSEKAFNKIDPEDQKIVTEEMKSVFQRLDKINRQDNLNATAALQQQGITFIQPDAEEVARWQSLSDQSIQKMVEQSIIDQAVVDTLHRELGR